MFNIRSSIIVASVVTFAISFAPAPASAQAPANPSQVVVHAGTGTAGDNLTRLRTFHQILRLKLGLPNAPPGDTSDLWRFQIGCTNCDTDLAGTGTDPMEITYNTQDPTNLPVFIEAWEWVQAANLDRLVSIKVDGDPGPDPTCTGHPGTCLVNYNCPQLNPTKCSQKKTSCVACLP